MRIHDILNVRGILRGIHYLLDGDTIFQGIQNILVDNFAEKVNECLLNRGRRYWLHTIRTAKAVCHNYGVAGRIHKNGMVPQGRKHLK